MKRLSVAGAILGALTALAGPGRLAAQSAPDAAAAASNDSAYVALRVMGKTLGKDTLDRVVEVVGRDGVPQPYLWKIVLQDGPDGTREVDVAGGKVAAQRTDAKPPSAKDVIHLADLNLDSSGAFDATDAQARKVHLRFDSVNYVLRASESTAKPQWTLRLLNQEGADVGAMRLAANDGNIVAIEGKLAANPLPPPPAATPRPSAVVSTGRTSEPTATVIRPRETPRVTESRTTTSTTTIVSNPPPPPTATADTIVVEDAPADRGEGGLFTRTGRTLDKTSHTVTDTLDKTGHTVTDTLRKTGTRVQRFFTGRGGDSEPQETPVPPRDPNYRGD